MPVLKNAKRTDALVELPRAVRASEASRDGPESAGPW